MGKVFISIFGLLLFLATEVQADGVPRKNIYFEISPLPENALARLRESARKKEISYKFPFEYKNALLLSDTPSGLSLAQLCFLDAKTIGRLALQVEIFGQRLIFPKPILDFKTLDYVTLLLQEVFPDSPLNIKEVSGEAPANACVEMKMIQWPKNIY